MRLRQWAVEDACAMRTLLATGISYSAVGRAFDTYGYQVKEMCKPEWEPRRAPTDIRLWRKVIKRGPDDCWEWQGFINKYGYGHIGVGGVTFRVHRVAYEVTHGKVPRGKMVLHSCDNRACCNPAHLSIGTGAENMRQCKERGRLADQKNNPHLRISVAKIAYVKRLIDRGLTYVEISTRTSVSSTYVSQIASGQARRAG